MIPSRFGYGWMATDPEKHAERTTAMNRAAGSYFVPLAGVVGSRGSAVQRPASLAGAAADGIATQKKSLRAQGRTRCGRDARRPAWSEKREILLCPKATVILAPRIALPPLSLTVPLIPAAEAKIAQAAASQTAPLHAPILDPTAITAFFLVSITALTNRIGVPFLAGKLRRLTLINRPLRRALAALSLTASYGFMAFCGLEEDPQTMSLGDPWCSRIPESVALRGRDHSSLHISYRRSSSHPCRP